MAEEMERRKFIVSAASKSIACAQRSINLGELRARVEDSGLKMRVSGERSLLEKQLNLQVIFHCWAQSVL